MRWDEVEMEWRGLDTRHWMMRLFIHAQVFRVWESNAIANKIRVTWPQPSRVRIYASSRARDRENNEEEDKLEWWIIVQMLMRIEKPPSTTILMILDDDDEWSDPWQGLDFHSFILWVRSLAKNPNNWDEREKENWGSLASQREWNTSSLFFLPRGWDGWLKKEGEDEKEN